MVLVASYVSSGTLTSTLEACWTSRESSCRHMEDVHSATPALPLGTLFVIIWRTVLFLCLSSENSSNIFFSHRTSTPSAFEVITVTRYINYLLTYLLTYAAAWWRNSQDAGLTIKSSWVRLLVWSLSSGYYLAGWLSVDR